MRVFLCLCSLSALGCGSERFESIGETQTPSEASSGEEGTEPEQADSGRDIDVNVNVTVNVEGKPAASASASNGQVESAPETDGGAIVITEPLPPLPIPTSYVPREHDGGPDGAPDSGGPLDSTEALWEPVPAVVLDDAVDSFREWFVVGHNFESQRLDREALASGGYAARATVTGNRDYTLTGVLFDGPSGEPRDAQGFDGVSFWVCGSLGALRFEVPTEGTRDATQSFGALIDVTRQWQLVTVRWSDLGQDSPSHTFDVESVRGLYFTVVFENYELWLHGVQFWKDGDTVVGSSPTGSCL